MVNYKNTTRTSTATLVRSGHESPSSYSAAKSMLYIDNYGRANVVLISLLNRCSLILFLMGSIAQEYFLKKFTL